MNLDSKNPACPACGDQIMGYEYRMTETHLMVGAWGASSEAGDHTGVVTQSLVRCVACNTKFQLKTLQRQELAS